MPLRGPTREARCWTNCGRKHVSCLDGQNDVLMVLWFLSENNRERTVRNKNKAEIISITTSSPNHTLKGITEARELGTTIGLMQMSRTSIITSPALLRDYDLPVKSFLPPESLLFLHLGTAMGWSNGLFDDHASVRSPLSPVPKVTAHSCGASYLL